MATRTTLYGITGCDAVKKARHWLETAGVDYHFHDYRKSGLDRATLERFAREIGWKLLLNRRGTTWRKLSETQRSNLDEEKALTLMLEHTSLIKRPVLEHGDRFLAGFREFDYETMLA